MDNTVLNLSDDEWIQYKAGICQKLYNKGLEYEPWSDERASFWLKSLLFFVNEFIQPEFPIPAFHQDWYWWSVRESAYMNLSPRDHAKTTVHGVIRVVWEICVNRNITFFIIFSTTDVSKLVLSQIKSQLTQNPRIRAGFGIFNPLELEPIDRMVDQDWSQGSITVNRDDFSIKDPTVAVAGAGTNVLSRRVDRLIVDDLLTDKIAFSEAESDRLGRWYFNDVQPTLKADGQEIITGTRYRRGDFYDGIRALSFESGGIYRVFIGDAVVDELEKTTLWPERWPYKALMRQRAKMGSVRFNRNYRNRITSDEDSPFPMIWFTGGVSQKTGAMYKGCYDKTLTLGMPNDKKWLRFVTIGVDPAIGTGKKAKFFAMVILGLDVNNMLVVAEIVRGRFSFPAQKRLVIDANSLYKPRYVVVENNSYQLALVQGIEEQAALIPIVGYHTVGVGKEKPNVAVPAMDIFFETARVRIPRGNADSIKKTDMLVEELHYWGKAETSDIAMAFWFAFERMKKQVGHAGVLNSVKDVIFGDRLRYERQRMIGLAGQPVPRKALQMIRAKAREAPLEHRSPLAGLKGRF